MKKLPPYSKPLFELFQNGLRSSNSINVFVGHYAWQKGKAFSISYPRWTIALPPWESAFKYIWPVEGYDICLIDTGGSDEEYLEETAFVLLESGARMIVVIDQDFNITFYRKDS